MLEQTFMKSSLICGFLAYFVLHICLNKEVLQLDKVFWYYGYFTFALLCIKYHNLDLGSSNLVWLLNKAIYKFPPYLSVW